jgi:hypothetical protein
MSAAQCGGHATVLAAFLSAASVATAQDAIYPAAQCAAFWFGYADYAKISPYLDFDPSDLRAAEAFREVALRLADTDSEVEAYIATQRPLMGRLMESYIYNGDAQSRDIFERLNETCQNFAARHPETRDLR